MFVCFSASQKFSWTTFLSASRCCFLLSFTHFNVDIFISFLFSFFSRAVFYLPDIFICAHNHVCLCLALFFEPHLFAFIGGGGVVFAVDDVARHRWWHWNWVVQSRQLACDTNILYEYTYLYIFIFLFTYLYLSLYSTCTVWACARVCVCKKIPSNISFNGISCECTSFGEIQVLFIFPIFIYLPKSFFVGCRHETRKKSGENKKLGHAANAIYRLHKYIRAFYRKKEINERKKRR